MTLEKGLLGSRENWDWASLSKEGSGNSRSAGDLLKMEVVAFLAPVTRGGKPYLNIVGGRSEDDDQGPHEPP